ncbi:homeobox-leucine zipper protein ATHB-X-like isoform X4 [Mangifera indica]|uniref:homeobox-leucine zipper protein ATHB-X-like isoform X4 n=1 Tax=Mangifera indica TaxID=29780 RepID=UPI001CF9BD6D|nr:homeobox-leucine zipper protein ATHB-X-like isoform X4 [Mangifera indica]
MLIYDHVCVRAKVYTKNNRLRESSAASFNSTPGDRGASGMKDLVISQVSSRGEEDWNMMMSMEDEKESSTECPLRKKLCLSKEQSCLLKESFRQNHTLIPKQEALAVKLKLRPQQVEVWFQKLRTRLLLSPGADSGANRLEIGVIVFLCECNKERKIVGVELPNVEVRYKNLILEADCEIVHRKPLPTLWLIFY